MRRFLFLFCCALISLALALGCGEEPQPRTIGGGGNNNDENQDNDNDDCEDPTTDEEFCEDNDFECGIHTFVDDCEVSRDVNCGVTAEVCEENETCGGAGQPGRCGCETLSDAELCEQEARECGELAITDACGDERVIDDCAEVLGIECMGHDTCGGGGEEGICGCTPTTCEEQGILCGFVEGGDGCGGDLDCDLFCAEQIDVGEQHGCAVGSGNVMCWGRNSYGQLGVGDSNDRQNPEAIVYDDTLEDAVMVSAGAFHSCIILADQSLRCWGNNSRGQLGVGSTVSTESITSTDAISPPVGDGPGALQVDSGRHHSCVIIGTDETFELADGSQISLPAGQVKCWGSNDYGQIGNPDFELGSTVTLPREVALPTETTDGQPVVAVEIAVGYDHACAVLGVVGGPPRNSVYCWGRNDLGQIAARYPNYDSSFTRSDSPNTSIDNPESGEVTEVVETLAVPACTRIDDISVDLDITHHDRSHLHVSLSVPTGDEIVLHDNTGTAGESDIVATYPFPDDPGLDSGEELLDLLGEAGGGDWVLTIEDSVHTSVDEDGGEEEPDNSLNNWAIHLECHEAALGGDVDDSGLFEAIRTPIEIAHVDEMERPRWITAGQNHTCVLDDDLEDAVCWGVLHAEPRPQSTCESSVHLVGSDGAPESEATEIEPQWCSILPHHQWSETFPAFEYSVQSNGRHRMEEEVINGLTVAPFRFDIAGTLSPLSVASGANHFCAIVDVDTVDPSNIYCLGNGRFGQIGEGSDNNWTTTQQVGRDVDNRVVEAVQIALGADFSCALLSDNNVQCWGNNEHGQIGNSALQEDESFRPFSVRLQVASE